MKNYTYYMDYKSVYDKIIKRAKNRGCLVGYVETHHILPKSLGGSNDKNNLVKLTAREHFICHWLLVKMFNKGTDERNKMLYAFWRMKSSPDNNGKRYINSKAYEKLRIEYIESVSKLMSENQKGENNSQFGKHWYTNLRTGESKPFYDKPDEFWVEGRNWFYKVGQYEIYSIETKQRIYDVKGHLKSDKNHKFNVERKKWALELWNEFLNSDCDSVIKFNRIKCPTLNLHKMFRRFVPEYKEHKTHLTTFDKCPLVEK